MTQPILVSVLQLMEYRFYVAGLDDSKVSREDLQQALLQGERLGDDRGDNTYARFMRTIEAGEALYCERAMLP